MLDSTDPLAKSCKFYFPASRHDREAILPSTIKPLGKRDSTLNFKLLDFQVCIINLTQTQTNLSYMAIAVD